MNIVLNKEEVYFALTAYLYLKGYVPKGEYNLRASETEGLIHIEATDVEQDGNVDLNTVVQIVRNKTF